MCRSSCALEESFTFNMETFSLTNGLDDSDSAWWLHVFRITFIISLCCATCHTHLIFCPRFIFVFGPSRFMFIECKRFSSHRTSWQSHLKGTGDFLWSWSWNTLKMTTLLYFLSRLQMCQTLYHHAPNVFMVWCSSTYCLHFNFYTVFLFWLYVMTLIIYADEYSL